MNNNDVLKKLRVALQLRDDQIVDILNLVDFRISKGEIGNFCRNEEHPKYMECGDQVLRNFLNGLVLHLRGTKENPKNPAEVLASQIAKPELKKETGSLKLDAVSKKKDVESKKLEVQNSKPKKSFPKTTKKPVVEKVKFKNGKNKKS